LSFFEAIAALSLTLAFSIPVLMDKVMRPRYEARFEEFRTYNRSQLFAALEKAHERLRRLRRSSEFMAPEDYAAMEEVVSQWTFVKENETRKDRILGRRKYLFGGWLINVALSAAAIENPAMLVASGFNVTVGQCATTAFFLFLMYSGYYGWEIYDLDDKISKFRGTISKTSQFPVLAESEGLALENEIGNELTRNNIPFKRGGVLRTDQGTIVPDFAIPSLDNPRFFVEVKSSLSIPAGYELARFAMQLKSKYPTAKLILITTAPTKEMVAFLLRRRWDEVFEISDLSRFTSLVKKN